jgi:hypothetical protein
LLLSGLKWLAALRLKRACYIAVQEGLLVCGSRVLATLRLNHRRVITEKILKKPSPNSLIISRQADVILTLLVKESSSCVWFSTTTGKPNKNQKPNEQSQIRR